jgi:hypothetical protein
VFDDPKVETIAELFHRLTGGGVGIVTTAFIADATPAALTAHTRDRNQAAPIIDWFLNGIQNYTWTNWTGPVSDYEFCTICQEIHFLCSFNNYGHITPTVSRGSIFVE